MSLDKFWLGFLIGIIVPILTFIIFFAYMTPTHEVSAFVSQLGAVGIKTSFFSLVAMPNFLAFFAFYWKHFNRSAQGVVGATAIVTIALLILDM